MESQNIKSGRFALDLIKKGMIPNTPEWCSEFGTDPVFVSDKEKNGRRIFASKEEYDDQQ